MRISRSFPCIAFLIFLPPILLAGYFLSGFPAEPEVMTIYPSLSSLPSTSKSWKIYPEDFYEGGAYVSLPYGRVRYWLLGPANGKKIVLIHGLSVPAIIWKDVGPVLAAKGFRVLLYDLYGRGYTDAPQTTYDARLYATQLALLMQHIKWGKANIVGISMGGGIAAAFTAEFPNLVGDKVALIASAGLIESSDMSRTVKLMSLPLLQVVTSSAPFRYYLHYLVNAPEHVSDDPLEAIVRIQSAHLPGFNAAIASSLRDGPIRGQASSFKSLAESKRKVLLIHGTSDTTVSYKFALRIQNLVPQAKLVTIENGGHELANTHPDQVRDELLRFLS